ncbi:hypothetical protein [uncultured Parolsenella sp.]|uniref:hypothetical protein n=1 Tax=uncultured Parolsenella sp. TaxID=2083008 RepID=UPI0025D399C3|nr:hypothetical protein [uncultured Parolsenella sp.]
MSRFVATEVNERAACNPLAVADSLCLGDVVAFGSSATAHLADASGKKLLVKVLRSNAVCEQRARDEYRLLAELGGAAGHAPVVYALGVCGGDEPAATAAAPSRAVDGRHHSAATPAIAMEYVEGLDLFGLRALISDECGRVASVDALGVARHLVLALLCCSVESRSDARYLSTVSHRDVSAGNVRFVLDGSGSISRAVLIDFGQGVESDDPDVTATNPLERSTTPFVGAPEMFDQRPEGSRLLRNSSYTDTYSVGCLLYYLRTGEWALRRQVEDAIARLGLGREGRQALCDFKMRSAILLPSELVTTEEDRELDTLIARCTEPGVGKLGGRFDLVRLAERLGISEEEAIEARRASGAAPATQVDPGAATVPPTPLVEGDVADSIERREDGRGARPRAVPAGRPHAGEPDAPSAEHPGSGRPSRLREVLKKTRCTSAVPLPLKVAMLVLVAVALAVTVYASAPAWLPVAGTPASSSAQTLVLYPSSEFLATSQLKDTADLVQARLSSVEGASAALLDSSDGISVSLASPLADADELEGAIAGDDVTAEKLAAWLEGDVKNLLANPLALYLVDDSSEDAVFDGTAPRVRVYRSEIASAEACTGRVDGLESASYLNDDFAAYVRLTLTDEGVRRLEEACGDWFDHAVFAFDLESSSWSTTSTVRLASGSYAISSMLAPMEPEAKMLAAALATEEYPASFSCEAVPSIDWDEPDASSQNQVAEANVGPGDAWVVEASTADGLTEGEALDARTMLVERCEAMGVPYALGTVNDGDGIAVKLAPEGFDALAAEALVQGRSITLSWGMEKRSLTSEKVEVVEQDGRVSLCISGGSDNGAVAQASRAAADSLGVWMYAEVAGIPLMRGWVDANSNGKVVLDQTCATNAEIDEAGAWLPRLIASVFETDGPSATVVYSGKVDLSWPGSARATEGSVSEARAAAKAVNPATTVGTDPYDASGLLMYLQLDDSRGSDTPVSLAADALDAARTTYERMDFESGPFATLSFYFGGTDTEPAGMIRFRKQRSLWSGEEPAVEVAFVSYGGEDGLEERLSADAATDEFYASKFGRA